MYYEITVALNGKHLFATAERSITSCTKLREVYDILADKFPENEGYSISVTEWKKTGNPIYINKA